MNRKTIALAGKILREGGIVVYPTDTAYALGGVFDDRKVIRRILTMKRRKDTKFPLVSSSLSQVKKFFPFYKAQERLAKKYWPGPLSIVVSDTFAVRVPDNTVARALARSVGKPLIATSANISGEKTPYTIQDTVSKICGDSYKSLIVDVPDLFLDAGRLPEKKTSTIVKVDENGNLKMIREGALRITSKDSP